VVNSKNKAKGLLPSIASIKLSTPDGIAAQANRWEKGKFAVLHLTYDPKTRQFQPSNSEIVDRIPIVSNPECP
jgi:hypothetical protein